MELIILIVNSKLLDKDYGPVRGAVRGVTGVVP